MRKLILLLFLSCLTAHAQTNVSRPAAETKLGDGTSTVTLTGSSLNVNCTGGCGSASIAQTYAVGVKFTPAVTVSKDFWNIYGSATKTITVLRIRISGVSTAASNADLILLRRSTAATGGTSTAPTIVLMDTTNNAATAVVRAYTAVGTEGTLVGQIWTGRFLTAIAAATATSIPPDDVVIDFTQPGRQPPVLRGTAQGLAIQPGTALSAATVLSVTVEFTEQ